MKKIWQFVRSMRFGVILLSLIAVLSLPGTIIEQGIDRNTCIANYGEFWGGLWDTLSFNRVFSTWYFVTLFALLCLNLVLCSIIRFGQIKHRRASLVERAEKGTEYVDLKEELLHGIGKNELKKDLFLINGVGFYGSFITHLGILVLLITAATVFSMQQTKQLTVKVGTTETLEDGTTFKVDSFDMKNISGETDYISNVTLTHPGNEPEKKVIRVNQPERFGNYTVYQESYGIDAATIEYWTDDYPAHEVLTLDSGMFLTLDDTNGVRILAIYPDYEIDENGKIGVVTTYDGSLQNPCYLIETIDNGAEKQGIALPGTTLYAGGIYVLLPDFYPVFNVKYLPNMLMPLMYTAFIMLIIGLFLCFFAVPRVVLLKGNKMIVTSLK